MSARHCFTLSLSNKKQSEREKRFFFIFVDFTVPLEVPLF